MTATQGPAQSPLAKKKPMFYNKEEGTFLGRNCKSWTLIFIFYCIYYFCLGCFWYALLTIFFEISIDDNKPKYTQTDSLIQDQPGLGIRPLQHDKEIASSIYYLKFDYPKEGAVLGDEKDKSNKGYASRYKMFMEKYETPHENAKDCDASSKTVAVTSDDEWCHFKKELLGECWKFPYGYGWEDSGQRDADGEIVKSLSPCFLIKVNRIFGLEIPFITKASEIPEDWPEHIKDMIISSNFQEKMYIDCQGEFPSDREVLSNRIDFFPRNQDIDLKYFPMTTKLNQENGMVAIRINNVPVGRMIQVTCKAYYKGVIHDRKHKRGMVNFQVFLEKNVTMKQEVNS